MKNQIKEISIRILHSHFTPSSYLQQARSPRKFGRNFLVSNPVISGLRRMKHNLIQLADTSRVPALVAGDASSSNFLEICPYNSLIVRRNEDQRVND